MTEPAGETPAPETREWRRRAASWALYGALSGAAASAAVASIERLGVYALMDTSFFVAPGLIFGLVVGWTLYRQGYTSFRKGMVFAMICVAAWPAAYNAVWKMAAFDLAPMPGALAYALSGLAGGLVWSALLTAAVAMLFDFARGPRLWLALLATGGLAGAVLVAPLDIWGRLGGSMLIYIILWGGWLAAWAAVFATAPPVAKTAS